MARRKKLPDAIWDIIHEKLDVLASYDYRIEPLTDYQFRINGVIDIYPVNKRWHDLRTGKRGTYNELITFIRSKKRSPKPPMDPQLEKELAEAAGESHYRTVRPLELNEVSLNGSGSMQKATDGKIEPAGGYFRKRLYAGHRYRTEKPEEVKLGQSIRIVFPRKRRKLVERGGADGQIIRATKSTITRKKR